MRRRDRTPLAGRLWLASIAAFAALGCGYRAGLSPNLPPVIAPDGSTVERRSESIGIEIFGNETFLPNLERDVHAALSSATRRHVNLTLRSPARSDLVVRGSIKDFRRNGGARTGENRVVETQELVTLEAELVDRRSGQVVGRARAQARVGTAIDVPGRAVDQRQRAVENAADRVLLLLLAGLEYGVSRPGEPLEPPPSAPKGTSSGAGEPSELDPDVGIEGGIEGGTAAVEPAVGER